MLLSWRWRWDADSARREQLRAARDDLGRLPRWARVRRQGLIATVGAGEAAMRVAYPEHVRLNAEIDHLARREQQQARELALSADFEARRVLAERLRARLTRPGVVLAQPRPVNSPRQLPTPPSTASTSGRPIIN